MKKTNIASVSPKPIPCLFACFYDSVSCVYTFFSTCLSACVVSAACFVFGTYLHVYYSDSSVCVPEHNTDMTKIKINCERYFTRSTSTMTYTQSKLNRYYGCVFCSISLCLYVCVCECLLQINLAGVPSSRATFGFPQYCASTCLRFGCTWNASCVDTTPKKKKIIT